MIGNNDDDLDDDEFDNVEDERHRDYDDPDKWMSGEDWQRLKKMSEAVHDVDLARLFPVHTILSPSSDRSPSEVGANSASRVLRAAFSKNVHLRCKGSSLPIALRLLAENLRMIGDDRSRFWQDRGDNKLNRPDTVAPVERVERAVEELKTSLLECLKASKSEVPVGQLNVSDAFLTELSNQEPRYLLQDVLERDVWKNLAEGRDVHSAAALSEVDIVERVLNHFAITARSALRTGIPKPDHKPPGSVYIYMVQTLAKICEIGGKPTNDHNGTPFEWFVMLVEDCEEILPPTLRCGGDRRKRRRRIDGAFSVQLPEPKQRDFDAEFERISQMPLGWLLRRKMALRHEE